MFVLGREADSTIKGFMYQFNLSLNEILKSNDESILDDLYSYDYGNNENKSADK